MALSNYDIDYLVDAMEPVFNGLGTAYGQLDGIMMHANNGDIDLPTFDVAVLRKITQDLSGIQAVLSFYETELKARKQ